MYCQRINQMEVLPVSLDHVLALETLPPVHKDPFDRLLIAQAQAESIPLLTRDTQFGAYSITGA